MKPSTSVTEEINTVIKKSKNQDNEMLPGKTDNAEKPAAPMAAKPRKSPASQLVIEAQQKSRFPVVCVGASAGGLEAFEQLFRNIPPDSGMAFVLVSHLDPDHDSMLTEILQRVTPMPVTEAQDQMRVAPNCVYTIPPNHDMLIFQGALQLSAPEMPRGQRMVIDVFMRSLAEDQGERAIGIILSGTGADGTLGLRAILDAGGVALVQEPASAKYDGMPTSAIKAGCATHVLPPDKMPQALLVAVRRQSGRPQPGPSMQSKPSMNSPDAASRTNRILMQLRSATGHDFSLYKKSTIGRRIERRMSQHDIGDAEVYARYLKEHPAEVQMLFKELLINVTSFFRDPEAFSLLRNDILPHLLAGKPESYVFRVWVAGCASGEEAYSIAILLREFMDEIKPEFRVQIYATDLDDDAIATARSGSYPPHIAQDVTPERLQRFFTREEAGYRVKKEIREMVVFATQNIIKDPPFTRLDLLCCRNLMIYLEPELQHRLIPLFHYALKPDGVLFLSPSESISNYTELFTPLDRKWKFYRAIHSTASARTTLAGTLTWAATNAGKAPEEMMTKTKETNFVELARRALLECYAPPSVVSDLNGNILYVHGDTGRYLRPAPGQATLNMVDMAREGLPLDLRTAIHHAASQGISTLSRELSVKTNGDFQNMSLSVRPLSAPGAGEGLLLVSFQDLPATATAENTPAKPAHGKRMNKSLIAERVAELERELACTRKNLQATIEELQASNEELKSSNEEMQSTNEELQSTNEELETSKEEIQSVNEELITVNAELQSKIEQLAGMQNDMKNLFDNINIGVIFLDEHLNIKRYTREAAQIYRLVASDTGRPLSDIKSNINDNDLLADVQAVLDTLAPRENEVRTTGGAHYLARIQPYRTLDNVIEGVVLTFTDISQRLAAEAARRQASMLAEGIVNTVREPLIVLNSALQVVSASRSFYHNFRVAPQDTVGRPIYELGNHQWDIPALRNLLEKILPQSQDFDDFVVEHDFPAIGHRKILLNARRIIDSGGDTQLILLAMEPIV